LPQNTGSQVCKTRILVSVVSAANICTRDLVEFSSVLTLLQAVVWINT